MRGWLLLISALISAAVVFVNVVFVRERARKRLFPLLRPLYKHVLNPRALRGAAQGQTRWGIVHHVGRHSGAAYATPVDAQRTSNGIIISLVYGPGADWCRNILAAGQCLLTLDGDDLALVTPRVISLREAEPLLKPDIARFWRRVGIEHCLQLASATYPAG